MGHFKMRTDKTRTLKPGSRPALSNVMSTDVRMTMTLVTAMSLVGIILSKKCDGLAYRNGMRPRL